MIMDEKINIGKRIAVLLIDYLLMTIIVFIFAIPIFISISKNIIEFAQDNSISFFLERPMWYSFLFGFSLFYCKDSFNGRSIAKRIFKLQVVDNRTGNPASPLKCFARNLFLFFWPIELIAALVNPNRRIGDLIANTKLVPFDSSKISKPKYAQIVTSLAICFFISVMFFEVIRAPLILLNPVPKYDNNSYNPILSAKIEKLYNDSLVGKLTAKVKAYDRINNKDLKYISMDLQFKDDFVANDSNLQYLKGISYMLLYNNRPSNTKKIRIKYIYTIKGDTNSEVSWFDFDK